MDYGARDDPAPEWPETGQEHSRYAGQGYGPQDYERAGYAPAPGYDGDDYWLDHDVRPGEAGSRGADYARAEYEQAGYAPGGYEDAGYRGSGYARGDYAGRDYVRDDLEQAGYAQDRQAGYAAEDERTGYVYDGRTGYAQDGQAGYAQDDYVDAAFGEHGYARDDYAEAGHADTGYNGLDFGHPDAGQAASAMGADEARGYPPGAREPARGRRSLRHAEGQRRAPGRRRGGRRRIGGLSLGLGAVAVLVVVVIAGIAVVALSPSSGPRHSLVVPAALGAFSRRPQLEQEMGVSQLKKDVTTMSSGQASHVVDAVYENGTTGSARSGSGSTGGSGPQIILLIAGKLSGASPAASVKSFIQRFKGAVLTSPGSLGGQAACVNAQADNPGSVALCAWFDSDTFGEVASPTMAASALANELRSIRPSVEHVVKG